MFQEMPRLKKGFSYSFMGQMYFLGMSSVKSFCPRRTSERRTHSFYLFLLFHMYLQAHAVAKYNTGLIALEMVPCLYVWWLSAWLVKHTLLQHAASLTNSLWSMVCSCCCRMSSQALCAAQGAGSTSYSASEGSSACRFILFCVAWQSCLINMPISTTALTVGFFCAMCSVSCQ